MKYFSPDKLSKIFTLLKRLKGNFVFIAGGTKMFIKFLKEVYTKDDLKKSVKQNLISIL